MKRFRNRPNPKVVVILPVHDRIASTKRFIECLKAQDYKTWHLVLIDDGSLDGSAIWVESEINTDQLTVLKGDGNLWWGGGLQLAYQACKIGQICCNPEDIILICNNDIEFESNLFRKALQIIENFSQDFLLFACGRSKQTGEIFDMGVKIDWSKLRFTQAKQSSEINCLASRTLFMNVSTWLNSGGFRPKWLPHYLSDYEFSIRCHRKGAKLIVEPDLSALVDQTTSGIHQIDPRIGGLKYLKTMFSKRYLGNPAYFSCFVLLASPKAYVFTSLIRIWKNALVDLSRAVLSKPI